MGDLIRIVLRRSITTALAAVALTPFGQAAGVRTVYLSGDSAPGTEQGVTFNSGYVGVPAINNHGEVAFYAKIDGGGIGSDRGIWSEAGGSGLRLIARQGQGSPDVDDGSYFTSFRSPLISDSGATAFWAQLTTPGVSRQNNNGVWRDEHGSGLSLLARVGMPAPGIDHEYFSLADVALNENGDVAFAGHTAAPDIFAVWRADGGENPALLARRGEQNVTAIYEWDVVINDAGSVVFTGGYAQSGQAAQATFRVDTDGVLDVVAIQGQPIGGTQIAFNTVYNAVINNVGVSAVSANMPTGKGIWVSTSTSDLAEVAATGDSAPGSSGNFSDVLLPVINGRGDVAFYGSGGRSIQGFWKQLQGQGLEPVAITGFPVSSEAPGATFRVLSQEDWVFAMNNAGQVAFLGGLGGAGVTSSNNAAIFAQDTAGETRVVVRKGELLDVDDGPGVDLRTVAGIGFLEANLSGPTGTGNEDGRRSPFNDLGQLAFWASFTDGSSGVFVSNAVANFDGDYNGDGVVDAADYTVWRDTNGASGEGLAADGNRDGIINAGDYEVWKTTFGELVITGPGFGISRTAPEPSACLMVVSFMLTVSFARQR